jgi:uncharacterized RDD family membrane protein YckC
VSDEPLPPPPEQGPFGQPGPPPPYGQPFPAPPPYGYQQQGYGYTYGHPLAPFTGYAGFWIRFLASLIDGLIVGVPFVVLGLALGSTAGYTGGLPFNPGGNLAVNVLSIVVGMLYFGLLEGGPTGQTVGKKVCNIRVVDVENHQPGIGTARGIGRYFARWLSQLVFYLGYFWMLWDPRKQCWHDKLARTLVVRAS